MWVKFEAKASCATDQQSHFIQGKKKHSRTRGVKFQARDRGKIINQDFEKSASLPPPSLASVWRASHIFVERSDIDNGRDRDHGRPSIITCRGVTDNV